jgi:hypothetical protein
LPHRPHAIGSGSSFPSLSISFQYILVSIS